MPFMQNTILKARSFKIENQSHYQQMIEIKAENIWISCYDLLWIFAGGAIWTRKKQSTY